MKLLVMLTIRMLKRSGLLLSFLLLCFVLSLLNDGFLELSNIINILRQSSIIGIIAVGMTLVILTAGIDLSSGSVLALSAVVSAQMMVSGINPIIAALTALAIGASIGYVNGTLITAFSLPPFIATLGTMTLVRGLALSFTSGKSVTGLPESFRLIGIGLLGFVPYPVIISAIVLVLAVIFLRLTPQGERLYALGVNPLAARFTGIPVRRYITIVYVFAGILSAMAGQILIGRLDSAQPTMGRNYEFDAIAAVVVGGTSFNGGSGGIFGTLIGVLIIEVLKNGMNQLNVASFWEQVVKGAIIALALLLNRGWSKK